MNNPAHQGSSSPHRTQYVRRVGPLGRAPGRDLTTNPPVDGTSRTARPHVCAGHRPFLVMTPRRGQSPETRVCGTFVAHPARAGDGRGLVRPPTHQRGTRAQTRRTGLPGRTGEVGLRRADGRGPHVGTRWRATRGPADCVIAKEADAQAPTATTSWPSPCRSVVDSRIVAGSPPCVPISESSLSPSTAKECVLSRLVARRPLGA
jgi:hypothetical protein